MKAIKADVIGKGQNLKDFGVDNSQLIDVNEIIRYHPVEMIGYDLRTSMTSMKKIV
jgi:ketol-acid reductoisomerase